jgi:hypothetical protein
LQNKQKDLRKENLHLKQEIAELLKPGEAPSQKYFEFLCDQFLTEDFAKLVKVQLHQMNRSAQGRRYSDEFKQYCLTLYFHGPRCYRQVMKTLCLPSSRALRRFTEKVKIRAGYNKQLFQLLKLKADKMLPETKKCVICIDEVSIKHNLFYHWGLDEIIGAEDDGTTKSSSPASHAATIMIRGITSNWKQPCGYILGATTCKAQKVRGILNKFVYELTNVGFDIKCLVTDMGANFTELSKLLEVTEDNSEVSIGGKELLFYFDPSHLIKATRNNLMKNEIYWGDNSTSWKYIEDCDKQQKNRLAPKLTEHHIHPNNFEKMRVKYAVHVISATVASALETYIHLNALPETASSTVEFISRFDKLFDISLFDNSSSVSSTKWYNKAFKGEEEQINFLQDMLLFLNNLQLRRANKKTVNNYVKFIKCWKISINSLMQLWNNLKQEGFKFLYTRRISQDCLENFFGSICQQNGNSINPTAVQFRRSFRKLFLLTYIHTKHMNCCDDFAVMLTSLSDFNDSKPRALIISETNSQAFQVSNCDYHEKPLPEQNAFKYVCGYLIHKCLKIHTCNICEKFAKENDNLDNSNLFLHYKAYTRESFLFGGLKLYIQSRANLFFANFEQHLNNQPGNHIYTLFKAIRGFQHPCDHFPLDYLLKLYVRLRIYYVVKNTNLSFKTCSKHNRKLSILLHL